MKDEGCARGVGFCLHLTVARSQSVCGIALMVIVTRPVQVHFPLGGIEYLGVGPGIPLTEKPDSLHIEGTVARN